MTRAESVLPKRVEIPCWRCGQDATAGFDFICVGGRDVAVHKPGVVECVPTLYPQGPGVRIPPPAEETP